MISLSNRPFSFDAMIGQSSTLHEMKKRSLTGDFPSVMIFAGPSGTGKTTLAFIVAALLNDPDPIKGEDCLNPNPESPSSKAILEERFNRDVIFYDASTMGKDDVIQLNDVVGMTPMYDKKKVIIIDEAQELSKAGKGVTLKLLEKKRKSSHIILCTMNLDAFDNAVKSRGQLYKFQSPKSSDIAEYLFHLSESIGVEAPDEFYTDGLFTIADNCEGSVRYAVQNFERCIHADLFSSEAIAKELGFLSTDQLVSMIIRILEKDKDVIGEILNFSSKDFFFKAFRTLIDTVVYRNSGFIKEEWKRKPAEAIAKLPGLDLLVEKLMVVNSLPYFREDLFLYNLSEFFNKRAPEVKLTEKPPVRVARERVKV